ECGAGSGARTRGEWLARHRPFQGHRWIRDSDLDLKCCVVELTQRGHERLPPKAPQPPVDEAIGTARNAIMIAIVWIGVRQDDGGGDRVEEPHPEAFERGSR